MRHLRGLKEVSLYGHRSHDFSRLRRSVNVVRIMVRWFGALLPSFGKLLAAAASVNVVCIMACLPSPIVADSLDGFPWLVVLQ